MQMFLYSLLLLFAELSLIRWLSCEIRIFSYFKNIVLISTYIGFGIGILNVKPKKEPNFILSGTIVFLLFISTILPENIAKFGPVGISNALSVMQDFSVWYSSYIRNNLYYIATILFGLFWFSITFIGVIYIFIPFGAVIGKIFDSRKNEILTNYGFNLLGSLAGIIIFTYFSIINTAPVIWLLTIFFFILWAVNSKIKKIVVLVQIILVVLISYYQNNPNEI